MSPSSTHYKSRSIHCRYSAFPIDLDDIPFLDHLTTRPRSGLTLRKHNPIAFLKAFDTLPNLDNLAEALITRNVQRALLSVDIQLSLSGLVGVRALDGIHIRGINRGQEMLNSNRRTSGFRRGGVGDYR